MTLRPDPYRDLWNRATFDALERFQQEAERRNVSMAGLALTWLLSSPEVTAPIVGPRRPAHFEPVRGGARVEPDGRGTPAGGGAVRAATPR